MRRRIDLDDLSAKALRRAKAFQDTTGAPRPLAETCPFTLDEPLAGDIGELSARLAGATG